MLVLRSSFLVALLLSALAATPASAAAKRRSKVIREPYTEDAVFSISLVPGAPFVVELPKGERATNIWRDSRYWMAQTTRGSTDCGGADRPPCISRVVIRAIPAADVVEQKSKIFIETEPSQLLISLDVEVAEEGQDVPAVLQVYLEGSARIDSMQQQVRETVDAEMTLARTRIAQEERSKHEAFKKTLLTQFRDDYEWGGDFRITSVKDNKLQTFISVPDGTDKAVVEFIDRSGKKEILNYEFKNGVYVLENKVLRPGEKLRLILGQERAWIALK
jgi:hypothetical protein